MSRPIEALMRTPGWLSSRLRAADPAELDAIGVLLVPGEDLPRTAWWLDNAGTVLCRCAEPHGQLRHLVGRPEVGPLGLEALEELVGFARLLRLELAVEPDGSALWIEMWPASEEASP